MSDMKKLRSPPPNTHVFSIQMYVHFLGPTVTFSKSLVAALVSLSDDLVPVELLRLSR